MIAPPALRPGPLGPAPERVGAAAACGDGIAAAASTSGDAADARLDDPVLHSMLAAWYAAGYYAGLYVGMRQNQSQSGPSQASTSTTTAAVGGLSAIPTPIATKSFNAKTNK